MKKIAAIVVMVMLFTLSFVSYISAATQTDSLNPFTISDDGTHTTKQLQHSYPNVGPNIRFFKPNAIASNQKVDVTLQVKGLLGVFTNVGTVAFEISNVNKEYGVRTYRWKNQNPNGDNTYRYRLRPKNCSGLGDINVTTFVFVSET